MAKGLFGKVAGAFVQMEQQELDEEFLLNLQQSQTPVSVVTVQSTEGLLTIEDIYTQNNIGDLSKSIFKINEMKSVLPDSLPNEAKKSSVEGTMKLFGLEKEGVIGDAEGRTATLKGVGETIANETIRIIEESQAEIVELENRINELKAKITDRKKLQEEQDKIITDEIAKITEIVNFIK